jgi:molybdopterin molybdotransferase
MSAARDDQDMSQQSQLSTMTIAEMRDVIEQTVEPLPTRRLPTVQCLGATLAAPLVAAADMPSVDVSAMDGFAFSGAGPWELQRSALTAGTVAPLPLSIGEAISIATGAATPAGTTAVLRTESSHVSGRTVFATGTVPVAGSDVRARGESWAKQTVLAPVGTRISASVVSTALSAEVEAIDVRTPPRTHIVLTGDELCTTGVLAPGCTRDCLGPVMPEWLRFCGFDPVGLAYKSDRQFSALTLAGADECDVIVIVGGTGHGPADHLRTVLDDHGAQILVDGVRCKPGGTQLTAVLPDGRVVIGLPGNPLAAVAVMATTAQAVAQAMTGDHTQTSGQGRLTTPMNDGGSRSRICPAWQQPDRTWMLDRHARTANLAALIGRPVLAIADPGSIYAELIPLPV